MHRLLPACALAVMIAAAPAHAAPAQGLSLIPLEQARAAAILTQARCCWRYVGWHRYWWRRWHRY